MILKCFAVFDVKAGAFLPPFFLPETPVAVRVFGDCVNDSQHQFGKHPEDYSLFLLGEFDCRVGSFKAQPGGIEVQYQGLQLVRKAPVQADFVEKEVI